MDDLINVRENCIGVKYNYGGRQNDHYEQVIEGILQVPGDEIEGIDDRGYDRWILQVNNKKRYDFICENFTGRDFAIGRCKIQIDDISSCGTRIEMSRVPFSVTNKQLSGMLRKYGQVYKYLNHYRIYGKYRNLNKTGDRIIWMKLYDYIPQLLNINKTKISSLQVSYQKQPLSCNICGNTGHKARYCVCAPSNYKNVIDLEDGHDICNDNSNKDDCEELKGDNFDGEICDTALSTMDGNAFGIDVHIDPSQNQKTFKCSKCAYKCNYEEILNEHIKAHAEENPFKCTVCDYQCGHDHTLKEHVKAHMGEEQLASDISELLTDISSSSGKQILFENALKCPECEFECVSKGDLSDHLTTHKIYSCDKCECRGHTTKALNSHIKKHNDKKFKCTKCAYNGTSNATLSNHMKSHLEDIVCSSQPESGNDIRSMKNSKRELSISPDKIVLDKDEKRCRN